MNDKVISLDEIKELAKGEVVSIPHWDGKGTINVRLRRIDLTPIILQGGVLPNSLKVIAQEAFEAKMKGRKPNLKQQPLDFDIEKMMPALDAIAKESLIDPKYEDFQEHYPLSLTQKLAIFQYALGEVQALESFRGES